MDQNQDDDPNEDSDWADVTTDEANNEPQKAGPSAVSIYLEIGIISLIGSLYKYLNTYLVYILKKKLLTFCLYIYL